MPGWAYKHFGGVSTHMAPNTWVLVAGVVSLSMIAAGPAVASPVGVEFFDILPTTCDPLQFVCVHIVPDEVDICLFQNRVCYTVRL